ncbi:MAG: flagellar hook-basal body complex protein [Candidatus Krumholzibacteriia bacterium]
MFKSLYSGVSGLSANLTALDVIGNNIANSNTIGFKSGRATFSEMLTQTMRSASRPVSGGLGGTNPQQVGLGTRVSSIDTNFGQGNFQTTGKKTDLAIQGAGFFILNDGLSSVYSRAGVFGLDSMNYFVDPSTGMRVQGVMADASGAIANGPIGDIFIDPGLVVPAEASTSVELIGNLDADSDATETIIESGSFLVAAAGADLLVDMSGQRNGSLNLNPGDTVSLNGRRDGVDIAAGASFTVTSTSTYQDLVDWLNTTAPGLTFSVLPSGALQAQNGGTEVEGLSLSSSGKDVFNASFLFEPSIAAGATTDTSMRSGEAGELRAYAAEGDLLSALYDSDGVHLNLDLSTGSTVLNLEGAVGGESVTGTLAVTAATTVAELLQAIQYAHGINSNPVVMNDLGQIVVQGEVGTGSALGDIRISEQDSDNTVIESAFNFRQTQQARDAQTFSVATTLYDSLGSEHVVNFTFEKVPGLNEWIWQANCDGLEEIISGGSGRIRFGDNGSISNFSFDDGSSSLSIRPQPTGEEGAGILDVAIDYGTIGGLSGLTQFDGAGSLQSVADGFKAGSLVDFNIDQSGLITGQFSNDTIRNIGRVALAEFTNPAGLLRDANNTFRISGNSGQASVAFAGESSGMTIVPGALETSNVDLALEFTRLVVAQRAFQANSRVITTGDQVMQELVNLIR